MSPALHSLWHLRRLLWHPRVDLPLAWVVGDLLAAVSAWQREGYPWPEDLPETAGPALRYLQRLSDPTTAIGGGSALWTRAQDWQQAGCPGLPDDDQIRLFPEVATELLTLTTWEPLSHRDSHPRPGCGVECFALDGARGQPHRRYTTVLDALADGWIPYAAPEIAHLVDLDDAEPQQRESWGLTRRWRLWRRVGP